MCSGTGMWASQIRIVNPIKSETLEIIKFEQNEAAFSICEVTLLGHAYLILMQKLQTSKSGY